MSYGHDPEAAVASLRGQGVKAIRLLYTDLHGVARGKDVPVSEFDHAIAERYQKLANARPREDLPARLSTLVFAIASTPATTAAEDESSTPWVWIAVALVAIAAVAAGATVWALRRGGAHAGTPDAPPS